MDYALSAYYIISSAEASSNLARFDGIRYGYRSKTLKMLKIYIWNLEVKALEMKLREE